MRIKRKQRRGMTSIMETIMCIMLLAFIITALMSLVSLSSGWTIKTNDAFLEKTNADYLVEKLQEDVKSSKYILSVDDSQLEIVNDNGSILYKIIGANLFRNNEVAMEDLRTCKFSQSGRDSIGIYLRTTDDCIIDLQITR